MGRPVTGPVHSQTISAPRGAYSPAAIFGSTEDKPNLIGTSSVLPDSHN